MTFIPVRVSSILRPACDSHSSTHIAHIMTELKTTPGRRTVFIHEHVSGGGMAGTELPNSWLAEGRAMLEAAVTAFADAGCDVVTTVDPRVDFHLPFETIRVESRHQAEAILTDMTMRTDFGLIIAPETGGVLHRLTLLAERKPGWNLGSSAEAVALCGDKIATTQHLIRHGFPLPDPIRVDDFGNSICHEGLIALKPNDGAGTVDTFLVPGPSVRSFASRQALDPSRFHCMRFVPGPSAGYSYLCDGHGSAVPVAACRHEVRFELVEPWIYRFQLDAGSPAPVPVDGQIAACREAIRTIPGLRGWVGVDVILDLTGEVDAILEINPRLTSSFVWALNRTNRSEIVSQWLASPYR
ncbi:ATP-grasp domain-containing protein [bacterium]|nr:ATP-grasp domain-containing protein [bacterium]